MNRTGAAPDGRALARRCDLLAPQAVFGGGGPALLLHAEAAAARERARHRMTSDNAGVRIRALVFALLAGPGLGLVALPDDGPRLFSLSDAHGPSALDGAGLVLVIAGWLVLLSPAWRRRHLITCHAGHPLFDLGVGLFGLGIGLVVASVVSDFAGWWAVGAALLGLVQLGALVVSVRNG